MSKPRLSDVVNLKRIVRYLVQRPQLVTLFKWQKWPDSVTQFTDSDCAGDRSTRKSTTGGSMMLGSHTLKTWSKDQSVIALSSGEAELYAANFGAAQALGLKSMAGDLGLSLKIFLFIDAKAALGIINRQGLGKVRHIEVQDLWLQEAVKKKRIEIFKVDGNDNVSDLMTKPLSFEVMKGHLDKMYMF